MERSLAHASSIGKWGLSGIVLCAAAFAVPPRYPVCVLIPLLQISGLACSIVAAIRGCKTWLIVSVIAGLLSAQAILFVLVDC